MPENTFGERIYKCRLLLGYARKDFANLLGVGYRTLEKWENDSIIPNEINIKTLKKYLDKMHI